MERQSKKRTSNPAKPVPAFWMGLVPPQTSSSVGDVLRSPVMRTAGRMAIEPLESRYMLAQAVDSVADLFRDLTRNVSSQPQQPSQASVLVVVDSGLLDADQQAQLGGDGRRVLLLDNASDPLSQISTALGQMRGVSAVHVLSHGSSGALTLGGRTIDADALSRDGAMLSQWGASLDKDAFIALYGCDVADGPDGQAFVKALARRTGATVAASSDLTGAASRGGDWNLEYAASAPGEKGVPIRTMQIPGFDGVLALTMTVSSANKNHYVGLGATVIDSGMTISGTPTTLTTAKVRISSGYRNGEDVLDLPSAPLGFSASFNATTGELTITSAAKSLAEYQDVLRSVTYENTQNPFANLSTRAVVFEANSQTSSSRNVVPLLVVDDAIQESILEALDAIDKIGQKISALAGQAFKGNTTEVPLVGKTITDLLYPNQTNLDGNGDPIPDTANWAPVEDIGDFLQLFEAADDYFDSAPVLTNLAGLKAALEAELASVVPGAAPAVSVDVGFETPEATDSRSIAMTIAIRNATGGNMQLVLSELERDLGLRFPTPPTVEVGGGGDVKIILNFDLEGHTYGGLIPDAIPDSDVTINFERLNGLAGMIFNDLTTTAEIGAIRGQVVDGSGMIAALFPVSLGGSNSRTLASWKTYANGVSQPSFGTISGGAEMTLPIAASINGVAATTANTKVVVTDGNLFDTSGFTYTTTDFEKLIYFSGVKVEDIIQQILKVGDLYATLDGSDDRLFGLELPFVDDTTMGEVLSFKSLFDAAISANVNIYEPVLNTPGRDQLTDYRLPLSSDSTPKPAMYSDLRAGFKFGLVINNEWPVHTITVAADGARNTLDDLVTDVNAALVTAGVALVAENRSNKMVLKASSIAVQRFAVVPVVPDAGRLSPSNPPGDLSGIALNTPQYYNVTGSTSGSITGTNYYTVGSSLGKAAVHAGILADGQAGVVKVTRIGATGPLWDSTRNGVTSGFTLSSSNSYLIESAANDLRRLGLVGFDTELTVLEPVNNGAVRATLPLPADLAHAAEIVVRNGSNTYTVSVADNNNASVTDTLANVQSALVSAGISAATLSARLVDPAGEPLDGTPAANTDYYLQFYLPSGSAWTEFSLAPTGDATAYRVVPLGFLSGDVSAQPRPEALRTFADFANSTLFPGLSITPVYDNVDNTVTLQFTASGTGTAELAAAFDMNLSPLGKIALEDTNLTFDATIANALSFGIEFKIGPSSPVSIASGSSVPTNGRLSGTANFTLDMVLQDRYDVTIPAGWTSGNSNIQDLIGDINRGLKQATAHSGGTVDLTSDRLVARRMFNGTQLELISATPVGGGSAIAITHTNGVLGTDLAIAFEHKGKHYVAKLPASGTTGNTSFADLVQDLNTALSTAIVDANGNAVIDSDEDLAASLSADLFFTTVSDTSGASVSSVYLFKTSPAGANWPATITLSAARSNPMVAQLGYDDSTSETTSVITVRAPGAAAKIRNHTNGQPIARGGVGINLPSFSGSVPYGFNTLEFAGTSNGSVTARAEVYIHSSLDASVDDIGNDPVTYFDRGLTGYSGTGNARAAVTLTDITASSGAEIDEDATIQIDITDLADTTVIVDTPINVPIPLEGTTHGRLATTTTVNFLHEGAQYSVTVSKPTTMSNTTFAQLAAQFNAALEDCTRVANGQTTNSFDASSLFSITQFEGEASLQVNLKTPTANPDYADVSFLPGLAAFGEIGLQGSFGIVTVADAMQDTLPVLDMLQSDIALMSDFKLPLINTPINELIDIKGDLLNRIDSLKAMNVSSPEQIASAVAAALSVPSNYVRVVFDATNNAYRIDFQYETGAAIAKPLDLTLADFYKFTESEPPVGLTNFNDRGSSSPLSVRIKAITTVSLGIDLTDPETPRAFLYGHDGSDDRVLTDGSANGTSVELQIEASADDITFTAAVGAFGIYVKEGTASLGGAAIETPGGDPYYTFDEETHQLHFARESDAAVLAITLGTTGAKYYLDTGDAEDVENYETSFSGTVEANLPLFTPTEFMNPFTNRTVEVEIQGEGATEVNPGGNIFSLQIADLSAFAEDSLTLDSLQSQIAAIYSAAGGDLSGAEEDQVESLEAQVEAMRTSGTVEVFTPDVDDANSGVRAPTVLDLLRDPAILVDGMDVVLGTVESGLRGLDNLDIPIIGPALGSAVDGVFDWRQGWLLDLKHELRGRGEAVFESLKNEVYEFLGPDGLDLLLKDNGIRSVDGMISADSPDDVTLDFLDADGNKMTGLGGYGAEAMEFKVRLGSVLVDTGVDLSFNFDALSPAFKLQLEGGLTFKMGWDITIGFGISLEDGFYFVTDSDPSANELELRFEAGLSGRQTGFNVAPRAGSVTGYSIVDAGGQWVYGPRKGDGSTQIIDVMPVQENGSDYDFDLGAPPLPDECAELIAEGEAPPVYWVVAVNDGGVAKPAYLDQLGQYRAQSGRNPDQMIEFNQTAPFSAFGSLFAFNLAAVDQIKVGLQPLGDADYYYNPEEASTITANGRNDAEAGVNRNNSLPTRVAGRIAVNVKDPSEASGDYVARPGPTSTGFMLMDGANPLGGEPVLDDAGEFIPVEMIGGVWYVMAPEDPAIPGSPLVADREITEDESENRITFSELSSAGLDIFELVVNAEAVVNLGMTLSVSENANIPRLTATLNVDWRTDSMKPPANPFAQDEEQQRDLVPEIGVNNIRLDLGSFLTKFIKPIAVKVDGALEPLDPLIDVIQTRLPVISDIAGRDIRFTNLLTTFGGPKGQAVATLIDMAILVRQLSGVMAAVPDDVNVYLPIGNFWLAKVSAGPAGRPGLGTQIYYDNNEVTAPSITQRNQSMIAESGQAANSVTNALGSLDALDKNSSSQPGVASADRGGFNVPILQDPITIFKLIMGQDVPLVTFSLPKLNFSFNQDIPLVKIVIFEVGLRLGLQMQGQLAMGYDTRGLRLFKESHNAEDLLEGFYISDRANADGTGADVDEFSLRANIALYGGVDLYLAKAGIEGGLNFTASINLNDPDNDGKLRVVEAVDLVAQTGNVLDLADLKFSGEVYARYYYWAGLKIWTPWKTYTVTLYQGGSTFARAQIFSFTRDGSDGPPIMASKVTTIDTDGTEYPSSLMLHMGPNALKRVSNQDPLKVKDGAERMVVWNDSPGSGTVHVKYLNYSGSYTKTFTGISRVVAFGGDGNDTIDASGLHGIPVEFDGGAGNDTITLGSGSASVDSTIKGGAGNDSITVTGGGRVRLDGEQGNDAIAAGTGTSDIDGGAGNDTITGGGSGSTNRIHSRRQFGIDQLVLNPVALINLLSFIDSTLPAQANLQGASSTIYAGDTNGTLFDVAAVTEIRGSIGADTFNVINATTRLANGGKGLLLRGGPGNDTYNVTADNVANLSADGITIDDGIYQTATATPGEIEINECGEITDIHVDNTGSGYVVAPDVLITDEDGGSGARAVASLDANGAISGIFMLAGGDEYVNPIVTFVERVSRGDKINFKSSTSGAFALSQDGNAGDDYRVSVNNKSIKFVGWAQPGAVRPKTHGVDEIDAVTFDVPNAPLTINEALDVTDVLTINAHRLVQNAPITADSVRITTDLGFSADHAISATNNGDVTIRVTGANNSAARQATAVATVVDGEITGITVTDGGAGYNFVPTVTVVDPRGTAARLRANVSNGAITSITILDGGEGYLASPAPRIVIAATASIQLNTNLSSSTVGSDPGAGDGRGTVTLRAEQGAINQTGDVFFPTGANINWQFGDYRYTSTNSLEDITAGAFPATLGGSGATAVAVLDDDGRVTRLDVTNAGSGYSKDFLPTVLIEGAATATPIVGSNGTITGFRITYPGEGYAVAPEVRILPNGFGKIVGADAPATAQNRNHIKSSGGTLVASALQNIGDPSKPLKTDVENMVAETHASGAGIHVLEKDSVRIGLMDHINGLNTNDGNISLTNFAGTIALGAPVQQTDAAGNLLWQDANKTIPIYARDENGKIIYQGGKLEAGEAEIKLTADDVDVNSFVTAGGGRLVLQPVKTTAEIGLNGTRARAKGVITNGQLTGFSDVWAGRGYKSEPLVTLQGPGERAFGVANVVSGQVTSINISYGGSRYNAQYPPTITLVGGGADGATPSNTATATATYTNGVVTGVTITNAGSGYVSAPEVVIALPGVQARARAIIENERVVGFTITNPGANYATAPDMVIAQPYPFSLEGEEIAYFQDGFDDIIIGRTEGRHVFHSADASFIDGVTLRTPAGGSVQMERIQVDGPVVIVGSGHTLNLTSESPSVQGTYVEIDDNVVVHDNVAATITATTGHVSVFGTGKGKIDGVANSLTEDLTITDVGDVVVTGAIGSSFPIDDLTINSTGGGSITLQQSVTIDGDLHIVKGGAITLGGNVVIGGDLIIDEGASVSFNGTVTVGGNVIISKATTVSFAQNVNVAGFFKLGNASDPSKLEGVTFASTARLDVSGVVEIYTGDSQVYGNRIGQTRQPTSMTVRSDLGDVTFQNSVNMPTSNIDVLKARDVTFAQELTAGNLHVQDATGQTRFQRATTLASMIVVSTSLVQVQNRLDIATGDAAITTNQLDFDGGSGSVEYIGEGASTLTIKPRTASRQITVGSPPGSFTSLDLSDVDIAAIGAGFTDLVIGNATAGTGTVTIGSIGSQQGVGNSQLLNATTIHGGAVNVVQPIDSAAEDGILKIVARTGNITVSGTINATASERNDVVQLQSDLGGITLNQGVYAADELRLIAAGAILSSGTGFVNVPNLSVATNGAVTLDNAANSVSVVGINAGNNAVTFRNDHNYAIGTVNSVSGINSGSADTRLITNGATVTQTQPITASGLLLEGTSGVYTLTNTSNNIATLAGNTGSVNFRDMNGMTIGAVGGTNGLTVSGSATVVATGHFFVDQPVTSSNGGISLTSNTGSLISNSAGDISATGGAVSLTSAGYMTLNGDITNTTHGVTLDTGEDLRTNGSISSYGNVSLTADLTMAIGPITSTHGGLTAWAWGNFDVNGALNINGAASLTSNTAGLQLTSAGDLTAGSAVLTAHNGIVAAGDVVTTTGDAELSSGDLISTTGIINSAEDVITGASTSTTFGGAITAVGKVTATTGTTLTSTAAGDINAGSDVTLDAQIDLLLDGDVKSTNASVSLVAGDDIATTGVINSGAGTTLAAADAIFSSSPITVGGAVNITADEGDLTIAATGDISADGNVALNAQGINAAGDVVSDGGTVSIESGVNLTASGVIAGHGAVTIDATDAMALSGNVTSSNAGVTITAGDNIESSAAVLSKTGTSMTSATGAISVNDIGSTDGDVTVTADGNIDAVGAITAGGAIAIDSNNGAVNITDDASVNGASATFTADESVVIDGPATTTDGDVSVSAGTVISTSADITAAGDALLHAASAITLDAKIAATGAVTVTSDNSTIETTESGEISGGGNVALTAPGNITTGAVVESTAGSIQIDSGATITASEIAADSNVTLTADEAIATLQSVTATEGDITMTAGTGIEASGAINAGDAVAMTAQNGSVVTNTGAPITAGGDVALNATANVSVNDDITSSNGSISLASTGGYVDALADFIAAVAVSMTGPGRVRQDGSISAGTTVTMTSTGNEVVVNGPISATGNVNITAQNGAVTSDAEGDISSAEGDIILSASGEMTLNGTVAATTGNVQATSVDGLTFHDAVSAGGNITAQSTGASIANTSNATLTAGGDISLDANNDLATQASITAGGAITGTAGGAINASAAITADGDIELSAEGHSLVTSYVADITSNEGNVTLESFNEMELAGDVVATTGNISLTSGQYMATSGVITAGGTITADATSFGAQAPITAGGNVAITAEDGGISTSADAPITSTTADITLDASDSIATEASVSAGGKLTESAGDSITANAALTAASDITLTADAGSISTSTDGDITSSGGDVALTAATSMTLAGDTTAAAGDITAIAGGNIQTTAPMSADGNVSVTSTAGAIAADAITATQGNVTVNASENYDANGPISAGGSAALESLTGAVNITQASGVSGADATINAGTSIVVDSAITSATGNVALDAGTVINTTAAISSAADATLTAAGALSIAAAVSATDNVSIGSTGASVSTTADGDITASAGNVTLVAETSMTLAGDVTATLGDISATATDNIEATGVLLADSNVTVASSAGAIATESITATTGNVSVTALNNFDANGPISAGASAILTSSNGSVNITSDSGVTAADASFSADTSVVIDAAVTTSTGDVDIDAGTTIGVSAPVTSAANVSMQAGQSIWLGAAVAGQSDVTIASTAGAITTTADGDISGNSVSLTAGADITTAGDVTSTADDVLITAGEDFDATGALNSAGTLTATAEGSMSASAAITAVGDISLDAQGTSFGASADGDIHSTAGDVTIHAATTLQLLGDVTAHDNVALAAGSNITMGAPVSAGGTINATSTSGNVVANAGVTASGNITFDAGAAVNSNSSGDIRSTNGSVSLIADTSMTLAGDVRSNNSTVTLTAAGNISETGVISAKGNASVTSTGGTVAIAAITSSNAAVSVNGHGNVTLNGAVTSSGATSIASSHGSVTSNLAGDIDAGGAVTVSAASNIALGGDVASDSTITVTAGGAIDTSGVVQSSGATTMTAGSNLSVAGNVVSGAPVSLTADGAAVINAPVNAATTVTVNADDVTTTAAGDLTAGTSISLNADDDLTIAGDLDAPAISLSAGDDLVTTAITATGAVSVTAGGDLTATGPITTSGNVTLDAVGELSLTADADISSGGIVELTGDAGITTAADVYTSGSAIKFLSPVTLSGDVNINTSRNGAGAVTFGSTVNGEYALTLWVARDLKFLGAVGQTARLASLYVRNARATTFVSDVLAGWVQQSGGTGATTVMGVMSTTRAKGVSLRAPLVNVTGTIATKNGAPLMLDAGTGEITVGTTGLLAATGDMLLTAARYTQQSGGKVYGGAGSNVVISTDTIALPSAAGSINGAGKLILQPISASRRIDLGRSGSAFELTSDELAGIAAGFELVIIGHGRGDGFDSGEEGAHAIVVGNAQFRSPVLIRAGAATGDVQIVGNLTSVNHNNHITVNSGGNISVNGSIGAQRSGNIVLTADSDNDGAGTLRIADASNATIGAANGLVLLQGMHVRIGTNSTTALIASPLNSVEVRTLAAGSTVTISNTATNLTAHGLYIGASGNFHPASVELQGNLVATDDINIFTRGNANIEAFRFRARDKMNILAAGDLKMTSGAAIVQDGSISLVADSDNSGSGTRTLTGVDLSEPTSSDFQTAIETVNLPSAIKAGTRGSVAVRVTNLGKATTDRWVNIVVYTSANGRLKAGDRILGRVNTRIKLAAGKSTLVGIDLVVPQVHGLGNFKLVAELLPYTTSLSNGGSRDANVAVSTQTFTYG